MVAKTLPDWLPAGWAVQFRVQKTGRKIEFYTNLETGKKFFSKDDVMHHIRMASTRGEKSQPTTVHIQNHSEKIPSRLVVNTTEYPEWLPNGWKVEMRTRKTGVHVGKEYKCYIDPSTECTFYSKPDVFRYLKTVKRKSCKSRNLITVSPKRRIAKKKVVTPVQVDVEMHNVEDLPPGWIKEIKVRTYANRLRRDPYYRDPVSGYVFRSKKDVFHYLETGEISKTAFKSNNMRANLKLVDNMRANLKLVDEETAPSSATKRQKLEHPVTRQQLSGDKGCSELSSLDLPDTEGSKLQDKRVPAETEDAFALTAEVVQEKHLTGNMVEECAKTEEDCSPSRSSQPKAEISDRHDGKRSLLEVKGSVIDPGNMSFAGKQRISTPASDTLNENSLETPMGKSNVRKAQIDPSKSKNKEKLNLPRRSSKRLAGIEPEQVNLVSSEPALQPAAGNMVEECVKTEEDYSPSRLSQPKAEISDRREGKRSLLEVEGSVIDPGNMSFAGKQPFSTPASDTLNENSLETLMGKSNVRKAQIDPSKSKNKEKLSLPRRSSKRLAGIEPEQVNLVSSEQALQPATRKSRKSDASQVVGLGSDHFVNGASQQLGAASEIEVAHHTLTDIKSTSHEEPLDKGKMPLDDQVLPKEQQQKMETEKMDAEKPEPQLSLLFGSDPCLEFAFKTLTGELPIADTVDNGPILKPAADMLQKENSVESGMEKSCSKEPRAKKSKKSKELKLPHRSSKRLAGVEPERLANIMSSEQALRNASATSSKSKAIPAVDLTYEASQQLEVGLETKPATANHPCTTINSAMQEESSNKNEKSLEAVPQEKPQEFEAEKAVVENPEPQFSFPFMDSWSDPCLDFAFKTLTGAIPIEDDLFHGYFQEKLDTSQNHRDGLALPDFGSPSFFQSDILPQFDAPEQSVSGQQSPLDSSFLPSGNVSMSNCSGVGSSQRLSMHPSFLPAGNVSMSNCNGFDSGQQLSMHPSFLSAGNVGMSNCNGAGSGQQLPMNSPFLPAGNVSLSNYGGIGSQKPPCLGGTKEYHGKVKS